MYANAQNTAGERRISVARNQAGATRRLALRFHDRRIKMIRKIMALLMAVLFVSGLFGTLAGCNTMEGAGQDIQRGGKAITDEAREQRDRR